MFLERIFRGIAFRLVAGMMLAALGLVMKLAGGADGTYASATSASSGSYASDHDLPQGQPRQLALDASPNDPAMAEAIRTVESRRNAWGGSVQGEARGTFSNADGTVSLSASEVSQVNEEYRRLTGRGAPAASTPTSSRAQSESADDSSPDQGEEESDWGSGTG